MWPSPRATSTFDFDAPFPARGGMSTMDIFDTRRWPGIDWRNYAPADGSLAPWLADSRARSTRGDARRLRSSWRIPTSIPASDRPFAAESGLGLEMFQLRPEGRRSAASVRLPSTPSSVGSRGSAGGQLVYCIVEGAEDFGVDMARLDMGEAERRVYAIQDGDLAAVVSEAPVRPRAADPAATSAYLRVNEAVARTHTIIPLSFGSVVADSDEVVELLRSARVVLADVLGSIRGKVELRLKVLWDQELVATTLDAAEQARINSLRAEIAESPQGKTYLARMKLGEAVAAALQARADELMAEVHEALDAVTVAVRPTVSADDEAIMDTALLVDRGRVGELTRKLTTLGQHYSGMLSFDCSGPRPPASFVNIKLALEQVE